MTKTTMAEAVRERPRETKTKAKRRPQEKPTTAKTRPVVAVPEATTTTEDASPQQTHTLQTGVPFTSSSQPSNQLVTAADHQNTVGISSVATDLDTDTDGDAHNTADLAVRIRDTLVLREERDVVTTAEATAPERAEGIPLIPCENREAESLCPVDPRVVGSLGQDAEHTGEGLPTQGPSDMQAAGNVQETSEQSPNILNRCVMPVEAQIIDSEMREPAGGTQEAVSMSENQRGHPVSTTAVVQEGCVAVVSGQGSPLTEASAPVPSLETIRAFELDPALSALPPAPASEQVAPASLALAAVSEQRDSALLAPASEQVAPASLALAAVSEQRDSALLAPASEQVAPASLALAAVSEQRDSALLAPASEQVAPALLAVAAVSEQEDSAPLAPAIPSTQPLVPRVAAPSTLPLLPRSTDPAQAVSKPSAPLSGGDTVSSATAQRSVESPRLLYPRVPVLESPVSPVDGKFPPMSIEQLRQLVYNPELQANEQFINTFVEREEKKTTHEFHDIVMNYYRSRKSLMSVEEDLRQLRQNYDRVMAELWIVHQKNVSVEGQCADGSRVNKVHTYEQCELNQDAVSNMATTLLSVRSEMQGDLALFAYSSQMSRLQVESYLHQLFMKCPHIRDMPLDACAVATDRTREELVPEVKRLKDCISVLFGFHRRPTKDAEFIQNIRKWTERLVAALLRVASYGDHLFVLNHVLRAPSGVGRWANCFVQVPAPATLALQTTLGSPVLDHAVTCLATVLLPVRARESFMCHMRINVSEQSLQMEQAWTLVDSDGEEDEDPSQAWLLLHENDIVSVLEQFPMDAIFAHLLQAPVDQSGVIHYDVRRCTEPTMLKLFAFCTTWISLLGKGLHTYSMARYRQLNKRLGRLIRNTMAFVSDHWLNFKTYYGPLASAASLGRLQMEFDQLFMRATYTILTAQKLGSWQFMAEMPFACLSSGSVWRLLWLLQQGQGQPIDLHTLPPVDKCKEDMKGMESRMQLADALQILPQSESIFLLTTFANMASARPLEEDDFIECITLQVFEIAYICDHTRDFCSKTGRELLSSIIQKHPTALSMLLRRVQGIVGELGKMSVYLFNELPASIWIPQDPDMLLLRQWLLTHDLTSTHNQLACVVLTRMNWDLFTETGKLVLDIRLHRQVALLLVEAYLKYIAERRASFFIVEGIKQMASYAYTSGQSSREQQFNNWAWSVALRLKLHREAAILHSPAAESHPFQAPALEQEQRLLPLASAARAKNPLACFLVLTMTDVGHDTSQFMSKGLEMLSTLAASSQFSAVIHVLSCVTPMFLNTPQYLLENETYQKILQMVLSADESVLKVTKMAMGAEFRAGTITLQFTQMIQAMVSARLENDQGLPTLLFWVQSLFKVSHFLTDQNSCYVLDHLVRWGYLQKGARSQLDLVFQLYYTQLLSENKPRGGFLTWVGGGGAGSPSLMEGGSLPELGWLAAQVLLVEHSAEQLSGVWAALQQELLAHPTVAVETALKAVVARVKPEYPRTLGRLSIYRWAQQALDMPISHPMMPLVWQRFFSLYLGRCPQTTQLQTRASVGERFFQSSAYASMLKRMKRKLQEAMDFHLQYQPKAHEGKSDATPPPSPGTPSRLGSENDSPLPSPVAEESPQYFSSKEFNTQLAGLYQMFSLWLEEPLLHSADLYLPALPPQYEAPRLMHVFNPNNAPWLEFVDFDGAQYDLSLFAAQWRKLLSGRPQFGTHSPAHHRTMRRRQRTATERIRQRLQTAKNPVAPPPLQPVAPPVPDISPALLSDKMAAIHLMEADLSVLTEFTKVFSTRAAQHFATDAAFLDLIPEQYRNVPRQVKVMAECRSRVNPLHRCSGPAVVTVRVEEREVNAMVMRKMDENRAEYKQLMIEAVLPPPQMICVAAVHVENAITLLIKLYQGTSDTARRSALNDLACTLFFHLSVQVCQETDFYPPTKQFFASCVEILGQVCLDTDFYPPSKQVFDSCMEFLGQEFVSRSPSQTPLLLQFCLEHGGLAGMVAPHFTPGNAPQAFVTMYQQLIAVLQNQNLSLVFMLLTKFDVRAWLEEIQPSAADKKRFLEILGSALMSCGAEPSTDSKLVFDLYLGHLRCILRHQFPSNLSSVLSLMLQGSSSEELHTSCWEMLLMECCSVAPGLESQPISNRFNAQLVLDCNSILLSTEQLQEVLRWLGMFFSHQRRTEVEMLSFGLYPRWGRYVPYLALLMGLLSRCFVAKVLRSLDQCNPFQAMQVVWIQQLELWQAWMEPFPPTSPSSGPGLDPHPAVAVAGVDEMLQPWTEGDATVAVTMVEAFRSTLLFTHATLNSTAPQFSSTVFSLLLMHYLTKLSHRSTPPHVSTVLLAEFCMLPWQQLKPDLQLLETMSQLKEHCATTCFQLIGYVLPKVAWAEVIAAFKGHPDGQAARRVQTALLLLLVQSYGDVFVRELPEIAQLLTSAEALDWSGLTVDAYRTASYWFLQVCQPQWALAQRSSLPALGFRLMKTAAEFSPDAGRAWSGEMSVKRLTYVHCVTQQLCQVTYQPGTDPEATSTVLVNLLSEIEAVETGVLDVRSQEEESLDLMKEVLSLLNNSNPDGAWQGELLSTLRQWLTSSPHSVLLTPCIKAAARCLASLAQMVQVTETCIQVYFTAHTQAKDGFGPSPPSQSPTVSGWGHILAVYRVPELHQDQFVEEALGNGAYLLLYAHLLHRRPLCQGLDDEAKLMGDVLDWTTRCSPTAEEEAKLLLWWRDFSVLWLRQLDFGAAPERCVASAQRMVALLHQMGEDRDSSGFLGVIGLGRRSQLSLQFRLAVRSLAAFLASQLLSESLVRLQPTSPLSDLPMARQARAALTALRSNKAYAPVRDSVESMLGFVHRTDHTARHVVDLVKELALSLYPDCDYLTFTVKQNVA